MLMADCDLIQGVAKKGMTPICDSPMHRPGCYYCSG
jgi:hypothetical protein